MHVSAYHGHGKAFMPILSKQSSKGHILSTDTAICLAGLYAFLKAHISTNHLRLWETLTSGRKSRSPDNIVKSIVSVVVNIISTACATISVSTAFSSFLKFLSCTVTANPFASAAVQTESFAGGLDPTSIACATVRPCATAVRSLPKSILQEGSYGLLSVGHAFGTPFFLALTF
jgi:hypothetical protein